MTPFTNQILAALGAELIRLQALKNAQNQREHIEGIQRDIDRINDIIDDLNKRKQDSGFVDPGNP